MGDKTNRSFAGGKVFEPKPESVENAKPKNKTTTTSTQEPTEEKPTSSSKSKSKPFLLGKHDLNGSGFW